MQLVFKNITMSVLLYTYLDLHCQYDYLLIIIDHSLPAPAAIHSYNYAIASDHKDNRTGILIIECIILSVVTLLFV